MYPELKDKVAVVSGAGGNLGLAVVKRLHAEGVRMALIDRDEQRMRQRVQENGLPEDDFIYGTVDLTQKSHVDPFIDRVTASMGRIDILLNIAGGYRSDGAVHETDESTWDYLMALNAKTAFMLSAAVTRAMIALGTQGRIITVASRAGVVGLAGIAAYSASKAAAIRLTESMAAELLDLGITVNAVLPSVIDTPQNRQARPDADNSKWVEPESIADVIAFLASDQARDISGASIPVYGRA
jgi:NAD(P)-dependent dehydrogenase (short-subunit alcohol dehydrogenase family)